jgi:hypothetical protein
MGDIFQRLGIPTISDKDFSKLKLPLKNEEPAKKTQSTDYNNEWMNNNGFFDQAARALATGTGRTLSYGTGALNLLGDMVGSPYRIDTKPIDDRLTALETKKEHVSRSGVTPERLKELEAMDRAIQSADPFSLDRALNMTKKTIDTLTTPSEWTVQGVVETLNPADIANLAGLGAGGLAAKVGGGLLKKAAIGATGGAVEGAVIGGATEGLSSVGRGKTNEQALSNAFDASIGGAAMGATIGGTMGAVSGLRQKSKKDYDGIMENGAVNDNTVIKNGIDNNILMSSDSVSFDKNTIVKPTDEKSIQDVSNGLPDSVAQQNSPDISSVPVNENNPITFYDNHNDKKFDYTNIMLSDKDKELIEKNSDFVIDPNVIDGYAQEIAKNSISSLLNDSYVGAYHDLDKIKTFTNDYIAKIRSKGTDVALKKLDTIADNIITPTKDDLTISKLINKSNNVISSNIAGLRIVPFVESIINLSVENPELAPNNKEFANIMKAKGVSDAFATVLTDVYITKNIEQLKEYIYQSALKNYDKIINADIIKKAVYDDEHEKHVSSVSGRLKEYMDSFDIKWSDIEQDFGRKLDYNLPKDKAIALNVVENIFGRVKESIDTQTTNKDIKTISQQHQNDVNINSKIDNIGSASSEDALMLSKDEPKSFTPEAVSSNKDILSQSDIKSQNNIEQISEQYQNNIIDSLDNELDSFDTANKNNKDVVLNASIIPGLDKILDIYLDTTDRISQWWDGFGKLSTEIVKTKIRKLNDEESSMLFSYIDPQKIVFDDSILSLNGNEYQLSKDGDIYKIGERKSYIDKGLKATLKKNFFHNDSKDFIKIIHQKNSFDYQSDVASVQLSEHLGQYSDDQRTIITLLSDENRLEEYQSLYPDKFSKEDIEKVKDISEKIKAITEKNTKQIVDLGLMEESAIKDGYLKRFYAPYVFELSMLDKFRNYIFGKNEDDNAGVYDMATADGKPLLIRGRKIKTLEDAIEAGIILDSKFVVPSTLAYQRKLITLGKKYERMADKIGSIEYIKGYSKVPNDPLKYGKMAGLYIPDTVYWSEIIAPDIKNGWASWYFKLFSHWKVNKTVKNIPTHLYNVAANIECMAMYHVNPKPFLDIVNNGKFKDLVDTARDNGLVSDTNLQYVLGEEIKRLNINYTESNSAISETIGRIFKELYMSADSTVGKKLREVYGWEDDIFKLIAFANNVQKLKEQKHYEATGVIPAIFGDSKIKNDIDSIVLSDEEVYNSLSNAMEMFIDYAIPLPKGWDIADMIVPFTRFGIKSGSRMVRAALNNPATFLSLNVLGGGVVGRWFAISAAAMGMTTVANVFMSMYQDNDELLLPDYMKTLSSVGTPSWKTLKEDDKYLWVLNAGRAIGGMREEFIQQLYGIGLFGDTIRTAQGVQRRGYTSQSFLQKDDTSFEKSQKITNQLYENFVPSMFVFGGHYSQKMYEATTKGENKFGEPIDSFDILLNSVGIRRVDKQNEAEKIIDDLKPNVNAIDNYGKNKKKIDKQYSKGELTKMQYQLKIEQLNKRRDKNLDEYNENKLKINSLKSEFDLGSEDLKSIPAKGIPSIKPRFKDL